MEVISLCNTKNLVKEFKEIVDMKVGNYEFLIDIIERNKCHQTFYHSILMILTYKAQHDFILIVSVTNNFHNFNNILRIFFLSELKL